jgi:predicted nucleic acid-binding protein
MFVIEASVFAAWCFPDENDPIAEAAFKRIATERAAAPALWWFELRNVLLTGERRGRLSSVQTSGFLMHVENLPIEIDREADGRLALHLARKHRLSFYDAAYLEIAQRRALPLATPDGALRDASRAEKIPLIGSK